MKKKISPSVLLMAFAISLFISMSLKNVRGQVAIINNKDISKKIIL